MILLLFANEAVSGRRRTWLEEDAEPGPGDARFGDYMHYLQDV